MTGPADKSPRDQSPARRPYRAPRLLVYGDLCDLTRLGGDKSPWDNPKTDLRTRFKSHP